MEKKILKRKQVMVLHPHEGMAPQIYNFFQEEVKRADPLVQLELVESVEERGWSQLSEGAKQLFRNITYRVVMELEKNTAGR